ncbi:MAG: DinB family protein [Burkholderiales bacterium]|nr:DinB family protein [Phycisphaerae bacterium]
MDAKTFRTATATVLTEICDGPVDAKLTWVVSNTPGSGVLGTVSALNAEQAKHRPAGASHSVAEHVAHMVFALKLARQYAAGTIAPGDWDSSWNTGDLDDAAWAALQDALRAAYQDLLAFETPDETFDSFETVCGFCATVAHAAYHLGAIRQLAVIAK